MSRSRPLVQLEYSFEHWLECSGSAAVSNKNLFTLFLYYLAKSPFFLLSNKLTILVPFRWSINLYPLLYCFTFCPQLINFWPSLDSTDMVLVTLSITSAFVLNCFLLLFQLNANFSKVRLVKGIDSKLQD